MEIIEKDGHNEICGGYSYEYEVKWGKYGDTLKDVLEELKEYSYEHSFGRLGIFGNPNISTTGRCWGIYINNKVFISNWIGETDKELPDNKRFYYNDNTKSKKVVSVQGNGGWFCGINIYIYIEEF